MTDAETDEGSNQKAWWRRIRRTLSVLLLLLLLGLVASAVWGNLQRSRIIEVDSRFAKIERGMTLADVEAIMGDDCGLSEWSHEKQAWWDDERLAEEETEKIASSLGVTMKTFFLPITWVITFDRDGTVAGKHR